MLCSAKKINTVLERGRNTIEVILQHLPKGSNYRKITNFSGRYSNLLKMCPVCTTVHAVQLKHSHLTPGRLSHIFPRTFTPFLLITCGLWWCCCCNVAAAVVVHSLVYLLVCPCPHMEISLGLAAAATTTDTHNPTSSPPKMSPKTIHKNVNNALLIASGLKLFLLFVSFVRAVPAHPSGDGGDAAYAEMQPQQQQLDHRCVCDSVLRPLFWSDFLPAYMGCSADLVCILENLGWISLEEEKTPNATTTEAIASEDGNFVVLIRPEAVSKAFRRWNKEW